jgi:hypothetical protein
VVIAAVHIYFGYIEGTRTIELAFSLPITAGILVVTGLGFWLGWIMATTKEAAPVAPPSPPMEEPAEKEEPVEREEPAEPSEVPIEEVKVEKKTKKKPEG